MDEDFKRAIREVKWRFGKGEFHEGGNTYRFADTDTSRKTPQLLVKYADHGGISTCREFWDRIGGTKVARYEVAGSRLTREEIIAKYGNNDPIPDPFEQFVTHNYEPKRTVVHVPAEEKRKRITSFLESIAVNRVAIASYLEIEAGTGLGYQVVAREVKRMIETGLLVAKLQRGRKGVYIV